MSKTILTLDSSRAAYEPLKRYVAYSTVFPVHPGQSVEIQSSSVTQSGCLWQQALVHMANHDLPVALMYETNRKHIDQSLPQIQRNAALIQLLRSWREGDEKEQRDTWEFLKQALDDDRLSDREMFP